jgi:5'-3' exonuclease
MQCLSKLRLKPMQRPIMLIDTSYYVFYRYFATYNWCKKQNERLTVETVMDDEQFMSKYSKMFEKTMLELCKNNKVKEFSNVVFVKDCPRDKIWRHTHINGYKENRDDKSNTFNKNVFAYTYQTLIPNLEQQYGVQVFGHDNLEADDVVAIVATQIMDTYDGELVIITNDNDYIQLHTHTNASNLKITNLQGKHICERVGCDPDVYIQMKKIVGDKSDNIPAIVRKCGEKTALKYATNNALLLELFKNNDLAKQQFDLNERMVDFHFIPDDLRNGVVERLEFL